MKRTLSTVSYLLFPLYGSQIANVSWPSTMYAAGASSPFTVLPVDGLRDSGFETLSIFFSELMQHCGHIFWNLAAGQPIFKSEISSCALSISFSTKIHYSNEY